MQACGVVDLISVATADGFVNLADGVQIIGFRNIVLRRADAAE